MIGLFKTLAQADRSETQLAYEVNYFPDIRMRDQHKIAWSQSCILTKRAITEQASEDFSKLLLVKENVPSSQRQAFQSGQWFEIHWLFGNTPTYIEWAKFTEATLFRVEFRVSPLAKNGGKIVILSLYDNYRGEKHVSGSLHSR